MDSPAVRALGQHFRNDAQTLLLLHDRAANDESPESDDEKQTRAKYVREVALNAIARFWPKHPDTLGLLRERAENDPTPWLRERAGELADEIEGKGKKE